MSGAADPVDDGGSDLGRLAAAHGISTTWVDDTGTTRTVSPDTVAAVVGAMLGETIAGHEDVLEALAYTDRLRRSRAIEPVVIAGSGASHRFPVRRAAAGAVLLGEDGGTLEADVDADSVVVHERLRPGLYTLTVGFEDGPQVATVVAPPDASEMPPGPRHGIGTNVAELVARPADDQGRGHVLLVDRLAELAGRHGIDCVSVPSLLPHRALGGDDRRGVLTRRGWAEWIVDVDTAPGAASMRNDWSDAGPDPDTADASHRAALERYAALVGDHPALRAELDRFLVSMPFIARYARFVALGETLSEDWRRWPAPWRSGDISHAPVDDRRELYHQVAQWQAHTQLQATIDAMAARGQRLEMHLDVGVHPHGYDYWNQPHLFSSRATIGRPPSSRSPGHNTLLPAARPSVGHADGYRSFASAVRHQLVSGLLHVPSVEAFYRTWWIPTGAEPADGTFVEQPGDELLAVMLLEAHRVGATIVAGDTPTEARPACRVAHAPPAVVHLSELVDDDPTSGRHARPVDHLLSDPAVIGAITARLGGDARPDLSR